MELELYLKLELLELELLELEMLELELYLELLLLEHSGPLYPGQSQSVRAQF